MVTLEKKIVVKNKMGLHARPAALFVQVANKYNATITVTKGDQAVNGKSIMGILMLAAETGSTIIIRASGDDAQEAIRELEQITSFEDTDNIFRPQTGKMFKPRYGIHKKGEAQSPPKINKDKG